jgi:hypothetical protein
LVAPPIRRFSPMRCYKFHCVFIPGSSLVLRRLVLRRLAGSCVRRYKRVLTLE